MNMFFSFGEFNRQPEIINGKLSDINNPPPLEELLIEDGIIEELQNKNEKLINYLNKEKIKQMIDYIIKEPKEDDHNKGHKFPFICSKLFNVEETKIMKYFFKTNKELANEINNQKNDNLTDNKNKDLDPEEINKNFKDKEININEIHIELKEILNDNNDNHKDNDNDNINNDEVNIENNINNDNNNQNKDNEDMVNQDNKEINTNSNNNKDKDLVNKNKKMICLLKSPDLTINNSDKNKRYESSDSEKENNTEKKNKDENNKHEECKGDDKLDNNIKNVQDIHDMGSEDKIELLDYFFSFLLDDSELNYVLCGYFSSLMINLLNINSVVIINYLFMKRKDILKRLVYHSYRKSIAETLCKVIKYEDKFNVYNIDNNNKNDNNQKEFSIIRKEIIKDIFDKIDINMDTEKLYSLSFIINDLIENKKIFDLILNNKSIIQSLVNKQLKDISLINEEIENNKKKNFIIIIDMIINWLNNINSNDRQIPMLLYEVDEDLDEEEDCVQQRENNKAVPEVHHTSLSQALFDILPNLIKNNFNKINSSNKTDNNDNNGNDDFMLQSYNDYKLKPLGLYRIKIVELLTSLISYCKDIPNEYDELLINSNFFNNAWDYIFEYQWNNLYQEIFFQFLKKLLAYDKDHPYHEKSAEYLFSKMNILNLIIKKLNDVKNNNENDGNSGNGYTAFLVSLSYKINVIIGGNYLNLNKSYTREGSITFTKKGENSANTAMISNFDFDKNIHEKNEKDEEQLNPIECMKKYCNDEWNNFFTDNISNKIKIYEEKLCQLRNSINDDLFANNDAEDLLGGYKSKDEDLFGDNSNNKNEEEDLLGGYKSRDEELFDGGNNNNEEEDLLGGYKSRDEELFGESNNNEDDKDDLVNIDDDRHDKNDKNNFNKINNNNINNRELISTDMEINLNDFNFVTEVEEKKNYEIKNDEIKSDDNNANNVNKENKDNEVKNANKENEEKNDTNNAYNSVNFWKNSLEKENNSYLNNLGEEALNDLSE